MIVMSIKMIKRNVERRDVSAVEEEKQGKGQACEALFCIGNSSTFHF